MYGSCFVLAAGVPLGPEGRSSMRVQGDECMGEVGSSKHDYEACTWGGAMEEYMLCT